MKFLLLLFYIALYSCNNHSNLNIEYPSGGYEFSKTITNKNFYCYPLIGKISRRDSFYIAYRNAYFFQIFNEQNISLRPSPKVIFRLVYKDGFDTSYIISLTEDEIILKIGSGRYWPKLDFDKLTNIEQIHYRILRTEYPLDEAKSPNIPPAPLPPPNRPENEIQRERAYDSIKKNTPDLLSREYYDYLLKKAMPNTKDTFSFSTKKIKITNEEFIKFIDQINLSGYWKLPFDSEYCTGDTDGYDFSLEANTGKKYNYVGYHGPCPGDTTKFYNACQELLKMAKVDDRIRLTW